MVELLKTTTAVRARGFQRTQFGPARGVRPHDGRSPRRARPVDRTLPQPDRADDRLDLRQSHPVRAHGRLRPLSAFTRRRPEIVRSIGAELVFAPSVQMIYPHGLQSTFVEVAQLSGILEGASRPGHFRGVATVVLKLFEIVRPDVACFGQKDYQQQLLIKRMVEDLHLPTVIDTCPTIREEDGLAMSSRNRYLKPDERKAAGVLYRALENARQSVGAGQGDAGRVRQILRETIESEPLARLDYAEVANAETLEPLDRMAQGTRSVALLAVRIGNTRLIDNMLLNA